MKYNLLDNLICPNCKYFPFDLNVYESIRCDTPKMKHCTKCKTYCSLIGSKIHTHESYPCTECQSKSVLEGLLICRECGSRYKIIDGIPHMLKNRDDSRYGHWDVLYNNPDINSIKKNLQYLLEQKRALLTYYALIGTIEKNKLNSIKSIEIGCGSGAYSLMLKKMNLISEAYLIDISPQALYTAKKLFAEFNEESHLVLTDGKTLPFKDQSFDLSLSGGVIEHFKGFEQQDFISEHCRVAKNLACQVPASTLGYWTMRTIITFFHNGWPFGNEYPMHLQNLMKQVVREDFVIIDTSYHDLLTAVLYVLSGKYNLIHPLKQKSWINKLFKHEIIVLAHAKK